MVEFFTATVPKRLLASERKSVLCVRPRLLPAKFSSPRQWRRCGLPKIRQIGRRASSDLAGVFSLWEEKAKMVGMNGLEPSTTAFLRYLPGSGVGVALVCNAEGAQGLSELLNDILKTVQ